MNLKVTRKGLRIIPVAAALVAMAMSSCAVDPASVRVPGTRVSGETYPLHIQFADVLNLPPGAKVFANGVIVGNLEHVNIVAPTDRADGSTDSAGYVVADVAIKAAVRLPEDTIAELRQTTPLGDVFISLNTSTTASSASLEPGSTIPLRQTIQAPPIEDLFAGLATFSGTGAVTDIQDIFRRVNRTMPSDPAETARIAGVLGANLMDLADNQETIDTLLDSLRDVVEEGVLPNTYKLDELLTPEAVDHETNVFRSVIGVFFLFSELGPLAHEAVWLAPLLESLDETAQSFVPLLFGNRPLDTSQPSNMNKLVDLIQNKIIPFAEDGPSVNLVGATISGPGGESIMPPADQTEQILRSLRMIGVVR